MSLLTSLILSQLEKEIVALEPEIARFLVGQIKSSAADVIEWAERKLNVDIDGDGKIGIEGDEHAVD